MKSRIHKLPLKNVFFSKSDSNISLPSRRSLNSRGSASGEGLGGKHRVLFCKEFGQYFHFFEFFRHVLVLVSGDFEDSLFAWVFVCEGGILESTVLTSNRLATTFRKYLIRIYCSFWQFLTIPGDFGWEGEIRTKFSIFFVRNIFDLIYLFFDRETFFCDGMLCMN